MTPAKFLALLHLNTRTNSTSLTDTNVLLWMENRQDEIAEAILEADEDILLIPQVDSLVASATRRDYALPGDIITRIKRVEAQLNGTDWIPLAEIDITNIGTPIATEANITSNFNNFQLEKGNPQGARFDIMRKSIVIYSGTITATASGLRTYCDTYPTPVTDLTSTVDMSVDPSTTTHGIPRPMHKVWLMGVTIDYKNSRSKPIALTEREKNYESIKEKAIVTLKHANLDREVVAELPPASDRGNDGFDY